MPTPNKHLLTRLECGILSQRQLLQGIVFTLGMLVIQPIVRSAEPNNETHRATRFESQEKTIPNEKVTYPKDVLPHGIRSRFVNHVNGLNMHILEAGFEGENRPCVLLLHGFPELAYSWRKVMLPLAEAGYHVVAPDQRGYGRTTGWDPDYDGDLDSYRRLNVVRDALGLISALGYRSVAAVVGHDFGSPIAAWCAVSRPDVFRSVVLMSAPFSGTPSLPFDTTNNQQTVIDQTRASKLSDDLAALPSPRKHYQEYYKTREANDDMRNAPQGIHAFLRGYYHFKSADWEGNKPFTLKARTADRMSRMPRYYIMDLDKGMAETVNSEMPTAAEISACKWLPEEELRIYSEEFERTGFQGGLQWYRSGGVGSAEIELFAGRTIDQPSLFIAGANDWGSYQSPGALEQMQNSACTNMQGVHLVAAGHWVQQEQPEAVSKLLIEFLQRNRRQ
ncbi:MAG: alpha/beta hydrolase [Verrucomicrobia bacterium]|nr:alpha/beta hydrolase [Verrucomicrobiota bacterium]MDA1068749.1 alpha/beta hydrolase [Verrucomicrobiota bacterium]